MRTLTTTQSLTHSAQLPSLQSEEKIALDSYEVTIFPAESVNNTKIVQAKGDLKDSTYRYERERT